MADRNLTIRFIGKDAGLGTVTKAASGGIGAIAAQASGANASLGGLQQQSQKFGQSLGKLSSQAQSLNVLSEVLNTGALSAKQFADSMGLTTDEALAALVVIDELNQGNVSAAEQYAFLSSELGVTEQQFQKLSATAQASSSRISGAIKGGLTQEITTLGNRFSTLLKVIAGFASAAAIFKLVDSQLKNTGKTWVDVAAAIGINRNALEGFIFDFKVGNTSIQKGLDGAKTKAQAFLESFKNFGKNVKDFTGNVLFGGEKGIKGFGNAVERLSLGLSAFTLAKGAFGGFGKEVDQASKKTERFSGLLQGLAAGASFAVINALTDAFRQLGQAITSGLNGAVQAVTDFEGSKAAAATLTDDVDGLVTALEEAQKRLGGQVTTAELVASSYDILSSGFTNAADAATIAEQSARGAIAGFSDAGTVADALTTVLNAYGKSSGDAAQIVDQLVETQNLGKITIDEYAQQLGRGASIAASAGVSFEEFSAAVAAATAAGVPAESAVSGVRQSIVNLLKPTNQAKDLLAEFGINNVQATLASEGLVGVLQRLADQGATSAQLSTIFSDVDALTAIAPIAGENVGKLRDALAQIEGSAGSADKAIATITNSLPGLRKQLDTTIKSGLLAFGQALEPAVVGLIRLTDGTLNTVDGGALFAPLIMAGEALANAFERNSQLVGTLAEALTTLASTAINAVAGAITSLANYIESTPGSFNRFSESLSQVADIAGELGAIFGSIALAVGGEALDAFQDLLPAIALAADVLGGIATAVKVLVVDTGALNVVLKLLVLRFLAVQAIALGQVLIGLGGAMGVLAAATKVATVAMNLFGISATAVLGPLALLAAGVAAVTFVRFTKELKDANDALDAYTLGLDASTGQGFEFANKLNDLNDAIAGAGGRATDEQRKKLEEYTRLSTEQVASLQQQLSEVQAFDPQNESQRQSQQNLIQQLNTTINALSGQITQAEGTLSSAASATGKAGGAALTEGFKEQADLRPVLDDLVQANTEALDKIELDALNAEAIILAGGGGQEKLAANEKVALEKRLKENQRFLEQLKAQQGNLADSEGGSADATQQISDLEKQVAQDRVTLARQVSEDKKQAEEDAAAAAINVATEGEQQRQIALAKLRREGVISEESYQEQLTNAGRDRIKAELAAEQTKYAALKNAAGADESDRAASRQRINDLTLELINSEIKAEEDASEAIKAAIEQRAQAAENAAQAEVLSIAQVVTALESVNGAYERQGQLLEARTNLISALGDAISTSFDNAIKLAQQDVDNASNEKERTKALRERDALEKQAAAARRASLERAQTLELLTFDLRQKQLQIENQIEQARVRGAIAENQAAQARAEANIATLQADGADAGQVRAAQLQLQASRQSGEALAQQFAATLESGGLLQTIAGVGRDALITQQGSALTSFDTAELDRRFQALNDREANASSAREKRAIEAERQRLGAQNNQLQQQTGREIRFLGANEADRFSEAVTGLNQLADRIQGTGLVGTGPNAALNPLTSIAPTPLAQPMAPVRPSQQLQPQQGAAGAPVLNVENTVNITVQAGAVGDGTLAQSVEDQVFAGLSKVITRAGALL